MIELLIVIAVLGILAIAVLSAINPIEQINRSRDTGSRSDSEQLISAVDRFYASNGYYPWMTSADDTGGETQVWTEVGDAWTDGATAVLTKLSQTGTEELKESFTKRIVATSYNHLSVYNAGTPGSSTYVCFVAKSASFQTEAGTRYDGDQPTDFPGDAWVKGCATEKTCYSCLP